MSTDPSSKVKIYDRPPSKGPSPLILALVVLVLFALAFVAYRALYHTPVPATGRQQSGFNSPTRVFSTGSRAARRFVCASNAGDLKRVYLSSNWA